MNQSSVEPQESTFREYPLPLREHAPPPPGEVHLWFLDLARLGNPLSSERVDPPAHLSPRQQRTVRRFYLRLLLGAYLELPGKDVSIQRAARGKPVLDPASHVENLEFSVAASEGRYLVGIATQGVLGVDLEPADRCARRPLALARRYFSQAETEELESLPEDALNRAFLHVWACKEAVVKAGGHGIANRFSRFSVRVAPGEEPAVTDMEDDEADAWRLALVKPGPSYLGAVALRYPAISLRCHTLVPPEDQP